VEYATRWCKVEEAGVRCDREAAPRRQLCEEHWLRKQPPVVRNEAAARRLALVPVAARVAQVARSKWPEGRRWCAGCQTFVLLEDCSGSRCRACTSIAQHLGRLRNEFGIDPATYHHLFELQAGRCAICRGRPKTARLAVDHDHACCKTPPFCGKCTRGLLCSRCNHELLGAAHDSLQVLENAVKYLKTPPFGGAWSLPEAEVDEFEKKYGTRAVASF
jgi:hypothetical protein